LLTKMVRPVKNKSVTRFREMMSIEDVRGPLMRE
jgi:hypothetical protein